MPKDPVLRTAERIAWAIPWDGSLLDPRLIEHIIREELGSLLKNDPVVKEEVPRNA